MTHDFISVHAEKEINDDSGFSNQLDNAVKFTKIDEGALDVLPEKKEGNREVVVSKNDKILQVIFT
jgi:hypothetical protein